MRDTSRVQATMTLETYFRTGEALRSTENKYQNIFYEDNDF